MTSSSDEHSESVPDGAPADSPDAGQGQDSAGAVGQSLGRIDRYTVLGKIADGSCSGVYKALDTETGVEVAIKPVPPCITRSAGDLERVLDAFRAAESLRHRNLARFLRVHPVASPDESLATEMGVSVGDVLIVMSLVAGKRLDQWRHQYPSGKVPFEQALTVCTQLAEALDTAHAEGSVHGELVPSKIIVMPEGTVKVLGLRVGRSIREAMIRLSDEAVHTVDMLPYMAPEQWAGQEAGPAADQYALGAILYDLVSGRPPFQFVFETNDPDAMRDAVQDLLPEELSELADEQDEAILRSLSKKPEDRFNSCSEVVRALGGATSLDLAKGDMAQIRARALIRFAVICAVVVTVVGAGMLAYRTMDRFSSGDAMSGKALPKGEKSRVRAEVAHALSRKNFGAAWGIARETEEEDPRLAKELRKRVLGGVGDAEAGAARDVAAGQLTEMEKIESWPSFAETLAKAGQLLDQGNAEFAAKEFDKAFVLYQEALRECDQLRDMDGKRQKAEQQRESAAEARKASEESGLVKRDEPIWAEAVKTLSSADAAFRKGEFADAVRLWTEAEQKFGEARARAARAAYKAVLESVNREELAKYAEAGYRSVNDYVADANRCSKQKMWGPCADSWRRAAQTLRQVEAEADIGKDLARAGKLIRPAQDFADGLRGELTPRQIAARCDEALRVLEEAEVKATKRAVRVQAAWSIPSLRTEVEGLIARLPTGPRQGAQWIIPGLDMAIKWIPPGVCRLGSTPAERTWAAGPVGKGRKAWYSDEGKKPREVEIKHGFWLAQTEVTVAQWQVFVRDKGYATDAERRSKAWCFDFQGDRKCKWLAGKSWHEPNYGFPIADGQPVSCISWRDARAYCRWLTEAEGAAGRIAEGFEYRLPTECEWEYACRAGNHASYFWWGDSPQAGRNRFNGASSDDSNGDGNMWSDRAPWSDGFEWVAPACHWGNEGQNRFGLADMLGNVWEWCLDGYDLAGAHETVYREDTSRRVLRGGSFKHPLGSLRCANRAWSKPSMSDYDVGFRVCYGPVAAADKP